MTPLPTIVARLLAPLADARRASAMVALAVLVTSTGVLATPRPALAWSANEFSSGSESMLISLQNQARASAGKKALKLDTDLRQVARWRSKDMVERGYFSHTIKGTSRNVFWYMQHEYGYCFKVAGENIGTVTWEGASEEDATNWVFDAFMDSDGHRDNIMGKSWDVVAVGAYKGPNDKFMWTVLFADSCSSNPDPTPKPTPKPHAEAHAQARSEAGPDAAAGARPDKPKPDKPDPARTRPLEPQPGPPRLEARPDEAPEADGGGRRRSRPPRRHRPQPTPLTMPSVLEATPSPAPTAAARATLRTSAGRPARRRTSSRRPTTAHGPRRLDPWIDRRPVLRRLIRDRDAGARSAIEHPPGASRSGRLDGSLLGGRHATSECACR